SVMLDRFRQIEPKVLFAVDSYRYNGKRHARAVQVAELAAALPSLRHLVHVPGPAAQEAPPWPQARPWADLVAQAAPLRFERLPFDHPLWIVYSSGTTGLPKAMVHGHGGIVLTHLKTMQLQHDVRPGDRFLFLGSTGWIVWNLMVGGLLCGATVVLYDGNPAWPDALSLWRFIDEQRVTHFGCGAAFLTQNMKDGVAPNAALRFEALRSINSTGSPLPLDGYQWVYGKVKADLWLASISGGTDIASGFVACAPILPVHAGEIQCRELGVAAYAFNEAGEAVVDEVGELVITEPMPSMPLFFWGDPDGARYRESYFEQYPGKWRHGDWISFTPRGTAVIYGRSDTTINRYGIRMGTAEIYRVVEELPEIKDSMVVDLEYLGRPSYMPLFVVTAPGVALDEALKARIREQIRTRASARHVPNDVFQVPEIPRTLTGKKMELPVRKLLLGADPASVASPDAMSNPHSFGWFVEFAARLDGLLPGK
ncbi:MAG: acetoacetate--CoA ligase, partial [Noviherbaspirillum sp.]